MPTPLLAALASALALAQDPAGAGPKPQTAPAGVSADDVRTSIARGARYLVETQHPDGSWGSGAADSVQFLMFSVETFYAFQVAANSLAFLALRTIEETPERRKALDRALEWLLTTRIPKRGNDWDVDCTWSAVYGFQAMVGAARDPRFAALKERIEARGGEFYALLEHNQEPHGGWGYYEGPAVSSRPTWSTSFTTACVIPALVAARDLGWPVDEKVIERAARYVQSCRLPSGAYTYDLSPVPWIGGETINDVKGSLGRIQVCNWALRRAGAERVTDDVIRAGLEAFVEQHKFLDVGRMRPIPHEAYYAVAAYFYMFGHCYAALSANELPEAERAAWHARLRPHLVKIQWGDGSSLDFPNLGCMQTAGTSFSILALQAGLPGGRGLP